ncbi:hypothetical protein OESDEN_09760 [Oesophagostomum dentatum]|uniref:Uncharacterized protein n=1 Tax=Oesophagostomum dentatum TaxID=61180 RepID=A0A0B1SYL2_OESDE|nr:hypothetical protein OESDEN_09760 [Oesophagostomum dentatum]
MVARAILNSNSQFLLDNLLILYGNYRSNETSPCHSNSGYSSSPSGDIDSWEQMDGSGGDQHDYMAAGPSGLQC